MRQLLKSKAISTVTQMAPTSDLNIAGYNPLSFMIITLNYLQCMTVFLKNPLRVFNEQIQFTCLNLESSVMNLELLAKNFCQYQAFMIIYETLEISLS